MARNPGGKTTDRATENLHARRPSREAAGEKSACGVALKEVQFQAVLEAIGDGFIALDPDYHCTYINRAAAVLLDTTADELTGRLLWEAFDADRYEQLHEQITRAAEQKLHVKFEEYCARCGQWFRWHCYPAENGLALLIEDVSELRQAERALRPSERRFRKLFESDLMGVFVTRPDGTVLDCNEAMAKMLGYDSREEVLRHRSSDFYMDPEFRAEAVRLLQTQGIYRGREGRVWRKDGSIAHLLGAAVLLKDEETGEPYIQGVAVDITERRRAEEALRENEERLRQVNDRLVEEVQSQTEQLRTTASRVQDEAVRRVSAESELRRQSQMLEGFFQHTITPPAFLDRRFNFIRVNNAYARATGHEAGYFAGRNYFDLYPQDQDRAIFEQVVATRQPYFAPAKPATDPDNPAHPPTYWNWQLTPLLDDAGQVQSLVLNSEDVTQQQQAFSELENRAQQLQKLMLDLTQAEDRERRRLAEILHDDLQQLLAAAKVHVNLLEEGRRGPQDVQEMARQAKEILQEAIEKSRSLSHELSPAILYQGSLEETFEWLARQMYSKYGLTVHVQAAGPIELPSEPLRAFLFRAVQELLFNVVKHARVNEAVVHVRRWRQYLCLSVSDRGCGLDLSQLKEIAGFGLLGIRERVGLLGGRMKIKSAKGRGSTFRIVVPDTQPPENRRQKTEDARQMTVGVGPHAYPTPVAAGSHGGAAPTGAAGGRP